jgi:hypothetical protein
VIIPAILLCRFPHSQLIKLLYLHLLLRAPYSREFHNSVYRYAIPTVVNLAVLELPLCSPVGREPHKFGLPLRSPYGRESRCARFTTMFSLRS